MLGGVRGSTTSRKSSHQCPDPRSSLPTPRSLLSGTPGQQQWKVTADFPSNTVPTFAKTEETHSRLESVFNFLLFFFFFLAAGGCFIYLFLMPSPAFELHLPKRSIPMACPSADTQRREAQRLAQQHLPQLLMFQNQKCLFPLFCPP